MRHRSAASGSTFDAAVVERGLRMLVAVTQQGRIRRLRGQVRWTGGLSVVPSRAADSSVVCTESDQGHWRDVE